LLFVLGMSLLLAGGLLLTTIETRRRMLRRLHQVSVEDAKLRTSQIGAWLLGR
jgi:heme exporter protein D